MNIKVLHIKAKRFHEDYLANKRHLEDDELLNNERNKFVCEYNLSYFNEKINVDNYCLGRNDTASFCYKVEYALKDLGSAKGGSAGKFILYYGKKNELKSGRGYPKDINEAFDLIKKSLLKIYLAAQNNRIEDVEGSSFWYVINYKIYWLYNPFYDIPVFKKAHVEKIIKELNISTGSSDASKRKALYEFKINDPVFKIMTNLEFMRFLYNPIYGLRLKEEERETDLYTLKNDDCKLENFVGIYVNNKAQERIINSNRIHVCKNVDYEQQSKNKKTIGNFGENLILNDEASKIKSLGLNKLVKHTSQEEGDGAGYDITSYDEKGEEIYIEVKATTKNSKDDFYLTDNEYSIAKELGDKYFIYRVYSINKKKGTYKVIIYSYKDINALFNLEPKLYLARLK